MLPPVYWTQSRNMSNYAFETSILSSIIVLRQPGVSKSTFLAQKCDNSLSYLILRHLSRFEGWAMKAPVPHATILRSKPDKITNFQCSVKFIVVMLAGLLLQTLSRVTTPILLLEKNTENSFFRWTWETNSFVPYHQLLGWSVEQEFVSNRHI